MEKNIQGFGACDSKSQTDGKYRVSKESLEPHEKPNGSILAAPKVSPETKSHPIPKPSTPSKDDPFLRAANEDDDGYDPYSDRIEQDSMWEEDPWR